jgi:hypothetical protein
MIRRRATLLLGLVGLALLGAAAARVIYTSSGAGIVTLLIIGALLLVSPFVIARVERLSACGRRPGRSVIGPVGRGERG